MKRGISPLIATVLIIGFTIGVAMLIFTWSDIFTRELTGDTSKEAIQQIGVLSDVSLDIEEVSFDNLNLVLKIKNKRAEPIQEILVRITDGSGNTKTISVSDVDRPLIEGYGIKDVEVGYLSLDISKVEVIPKINIDGELVIGSNVKEELSVSDELNAESILQNGLKLFIPFDSDPLEDLVGNSFTNYGATYISSGGNDGFGSYEFDGVTGYINIPTNTNLEVDGDMTLAFWLYSKNVGSGRINPLDKSYGGEFGLTIELAGSLSYFHGTDRVGGYYMSWQSLPGGSLVNDEWQFVVITRDITTNILRSYLDGEFVRSLSYPITDPNKLPSKSIYPVRIARGYTGVRYEGKMNNVMIFDRALTLEEINLLYNY